MTAACPKCGFNPAAPVLASWSFHVPREVKSGNVRIHNVGGSRWAYKAERRGWESDMAKCALVHRIPVASGKRRVTLTRIIGYRQRAFDRDNLATGCKPIVDAMVRAGMLLGDSERHAELHYQQQKRDELGGLFVLVEEVGS